MPVWNDRISPVFDVARSIRVFDIRDGLVVDVSHHRLDENGRATALGALGVDVVICAAISASLESTLWVTGIEVIPDTCGIAEEIIAAFVTGDRKLERFRSPGKRLCGRASPASARSDHTRSRARRRGHNVN